MNGLNTTEDGGGELGSEGVPCAVLDLAVSTLRAMHNEKNDAVLFLFENAHHLAPEPKWLYVSHLD